MLTIGALRIRIGFWGPLYHNYNKDPPSIVLVTIWAPILELFALTLKHALAPPFMCKAYDTEAHGLSGAGQVGD